MHPPTRRTLSLTLIVDCLLPQSTIDILLIFLTSWQVHRGPFADWRQEIRSPYLRPRVVLSAVTGISGDCQPNDKRTVDWVM